jgi:hypothetical protein
MAQAATTSRARTDAWLGLVRKNSVHRFSAQCNIVTSLHPDRPGWSGVSLFFLNVVDFKGVQAGWHFG